mmetsp:Transcript_17185/g.54672  ORF Transcript_17185/g.54672 Transcript_17185/m.54672 type:complete len:248 (-) Transcript_17185:1516-2259(-)
MPHFTTCQPDVVAGASATSLSASYDKQQQQQQQRQQQRYLQREQNLNRPSAHLGDSFSLPAVDARQLNQQYQQYAEAETETVLSVATTGVGQRHVVAKIVKDFHALKGRRIFERPPQFKALSLADQASRLPSAKGAGSKQQLEWTRCESTYARVRAFCATLPCVQRQAPKERLAGVNDAHAFAAARLQGFWRVLDAQRVARICAERVMTVQVDCDSGFPYYAHAETKYLSWEPSIFAPRTQAESKSS